MSVKRFYINVIFFFQPKPGEKPIPGMIFKDWKQKYVKDEWRFICIFNRYTFLKFQCVTKCCCVAVEVKEPEPPTETGKQEEREPAAKSSTPAPASKPPPEKRARLQ